MPCHLPVLQPDGESARREVYPDLTFDVAGLVRRTAGRDLLDRVVADHLDPLDSAMTIFEANGDYATTERPRGWCRFVDEKSLASLSLADAAQARNAIDSEQWWCRASCRRPALEAIERGSPAEFDCPGGLRVHAVPIHAGGKVIGGISIACGGPPTDDERLQVLADRLGTGIEPLRQAALLSRQPSNDAIAVSRSSMDATARLLGQLVEARAEDAARQEQIALFVDTVAHDLRNPLGAILLGATTLTRSSQPDDKHVRVVAERIRRSAQTMNRLVEEVLDVARTRRGGAFSVSLGRHVLDRLVTDVVDEARAGRPGIELQLRCSGDSTLECDPVQARRVIANLITNAIRHGEGSPVEVDVAGSAYGVVFRVHNGGPAIAAEALGTIFEPFDQGHRQLTGKRTVGLGLGLYIAQEIMRAHGGTIEVQSAEAAGTTFTANFPRH